MFGAVTDDTDSQWHLDKRVPIAIVTALFIQTLSVVYVVADWRATTDARLSAVELALASGALTDQRQWDRMQDLTREQEALHVGLAGLDERTKAIATQTERILTLILKQMEGAP